MPSEFAARGYASKNCEIRFERTYHLLAWQYSAMRNAESDALSSCATGRYIEFLEGGGLVKLIYFNTILSDCQEKIPLSFKKTGFL